MCIHVHRPFLEILESIIQIWFDSRVGSFMSHNGLILQNVGPAYVAIFSSSPDSATAHVALVFRCGTDIASTMGRRRCCQSASQSSSCDGNGPEDVAARSDPVGGGTNALRECQIWPESITLLKDLFAHLLLRNSCRIKVHNMWGVTPWLVVYKKHDLCSW